jgi:hypothetical protein
MENEEGYMASFSRHHETKQKNLILSLSPFPLPHLGVLCCTQYCVGKKKIYWCIRSFPSGAMRNVDTTGKCGKEARRMEQPLDTLTSALCYKTRTARGKSPAALAGLSVMFTIWEQRWRMRHINKQFKSIRSNDKIILKRPPACAHTKSRVGEFEVVKHVRPSSLPLHFYSSEVCSI